MLILWVFILNIEKNGLRNTAGSVTGSSKMTVTNRNKLYFQHHVPKPLTKDPVYPG